MKKTTIIIAYLLAVLPLLPALAQNVRNDQVGVLEAPNATPWGSWTRAVYCPPGSWAAGYTMKVEPNQGRGDDTALNAVALYCRDRNGRDVTRISPHDGFWGSWGEGANCPQGQFLILFNLRVEPSQGSGDDTGANSVAFLCSNSGGKITEASNRGQWGSLGEWQGQGLLPGAICGVRAKIEAQQGTGDDTALNNLEFTWCRI
jgi:Vitelline membrane outer layer protein I (VOMI).